MYTSQLGASTKVAAAPIRLLVLTSPRLTEYYHAYFTLIHLLTQPKDRSSSMCEFDFAVSRENHVLANHVLKNVPTLYVNWHASAKQLPVLTLMDFVAPSLCVR